MDLDFDRLSERSSSPLSSLASRSPSPPADYSFGHYLSPVSSQQSSNRGSPTPRMAETASSADGDGAPPPKRRRVTGPKIRETMRLDLSVTPSPPGQDKQIESLMKLLHGKKKIVVIAGAGISVSAGIPDFRSKEGLFKTLKSNYKLKSSGKDLFDASVYSQDSSTTSFHHMVREMSAKTREAQPTPFHHLLARLAHEGRLLRLYTQNVDGIETSMEPLQTRIPLQKPWPKTVQLHGSLEKMVCSKCKTLSEFDGSLFDGPQAPLCKQCETDDFTRTTFAGKRSHGIGRLRPRMVLYNEHNPDEDAIGEISSADLRTRPDALIVVGTTLKVYGIRKLAKELVGVVRGRRDGLTVWINHGREPSGYGLENCWDIIVKGPCDEVARLAAMPKWNEDPSMDEARANSDHANPFVGVFPGKSKSEVGMPTPISSPKTECDTDSMLSVLDDKPVSSLRLTADVKPTKKSIADLLKGQKPSIKLTVAKRSQPKKAPQAKRVPDKNKKESALAANNMKLTNTFAVSKNSKQPLNAKLVKKEGMEHDLSIISVEHNENDPLDSRPHGTSTLPSSQLPTPIFNPSQSPSSLHSNVGSIMASKEPQVSYPERLRSPGGALENVSHGDPFESGLAAASESFPPTTDVGSMRKRRISDEQVMRVHGILNEVSSSG